MLSATLPTFGSAHQQRSYMNYRADLSCLGYGLLGGRVFGAGCLQSFSQPQSDIKQKRFNNT